MRVVINQKRAIMRYNTMMYWKYVKNNGVKIVCHQGVFVGIDGHVFTGTNWWFCERDVVGQSVHQNVMLGDVMIVESMESAFCKSTPSAPSSHFTDLIISKTPETPHITERL